MILVHGKVKRPQAVHRKAPKDGVHRVKSKDGTIRSPMTFKIGKDRAYGGNEGIYVRVREDIGCKVYYALRLNTVRTEEQVKSVMGWMERYADLGICARPRGITRAYIDLVYEGQHIERKVWGILVEHVFYPERAWYKYCLGYPYDWIADNHEDHNPHGFKRFCKRAKKHMGKLVEVQDKALTLGGCAWCARKQKWLIIDVDFREKAVFK